MHKLINWFVVMVLLASCSDNPTSKSTTKKQENKVLSAPRPANTDPVSNNQILGIWTDGQTNGDNAVFKIRKDSIYYVDHFKSYPYQIKGDSLSIKYPDYDYKARVSWLKDTLVFTSAEDGVVKYWRFKD